MRTAGDALSKSNDQTFVTAYQDVILRKKLNTALVRAKYAAIGAAIGGFVGATLGGTRTTLGSLVTELKENGEREATSENT